MPVSSLYIHRPVLNADQIIEWAKSQGFRTTLPPEDLHVTIAFSRAPVSWPAAENDKLLVAADGRGVERFDGGAVVLRFRSPVLEQRWQFLVNSGASWDYPDYHPHITISFEADHDPASITPFYGIIELGGEQLAEVNENWKDNVVEKAGARHNKDDLRMLQEMHDHSVALGAKCPDEQDEVEKRQDEPPDYRIAKVDESLGMVFGYSIICKVGGEDYYDLNVDLDGKHKGEKVPEHIPESTMLKAACEFMQTARTGNEMHKGPDSGQYVFAFPLTTDIAKAMGIETRVTGLMVGFKPPPELLAKFKDGTYKGFSIEGRRIAYKEHD